MQIKKERQAASLPAHGPVLKNLCSVQPSASFREDDQVASEEVLKLRWTQADVPEKRFYFPKKQKLTGSFNEQVVTGCLRALETACGGHSTGAEDTQQRQKRQMSFITFYSPNKISKAGWRDPISQRRTWCFWFQFSSSFCSSFSFHVLKNQRLISLKSVLLKSVIIRTRKIRN